MRFLVSCAIALLLSAPAFADNRELLATIVHRAQQTESDSLVIIQDGDVVYSSDFNKPDQPRNVQSLTKSIVALAIGILVDDGKISSFDLPMSVWFPEFQADARKSKITLRMVMSQTSGYPDVKTVPDFWKNDDLVAAAAATALIGEPGAQFQYSSIAAMLLQRVIERSSGQSVTEFVRRRIFVPLEITDFTWSKDKKGHEQTSGGLFFSTADLVKLAKMLLAGGRVAKSTLIRPETFAALTTKSQAYAEYGLLFWLDQSVAAEPLVSAIGWGGQYVTIFPAKHLIAIRAKNPHDIPSERKIDLSFGEFRSLIARWQ